MNYLLSHPITFFGYCFPNAGCTPAHSSWKYYFDVSSLNESLRLFITIVHVSGIVNYTRCPTEIYPLQYLQALFLIEIDFTDIILSRFREIVSIFNPLMLHRTLL